MAHHLKPDSWGPTLLALATTLWLTIASHVGGFFYWFGLNLGNIGIFISSLAAMAGIVWKIKTDKSRTAMEVKELKLKVWELGSIAHKNEDRLAYQAADIHRLREVSHRQANDLNKYRLILIEHKIADPFEVPPPAPFPPRPGKPASIAGEPDTPLPPDAVDGRPPEPNKS